MKKTLSPEELPTDIKLIKKFNLPQQQVQAQVMHNMIQMMMTFSWLMNLRQKC